MRLFGIRETTRTFTSFYYVLENLVKNSGGKKVATLIVSDYTYNQVKKLPEAYFRGRWLYIDYKNTTVFIKKLNLHKLQRLSPTQVKAYFDEMEENSDE